MANKLMCGKCFPKEVCMCNKTKTLDLTKPVRTRDGRMARIICTDRKDPFPVVALVQNGYEELLTYRLDGSYVVPDSHNDLINVPVKKTKKVLLLCEKKFPNIVAVRSADTLLTWSSEMRAAHNILDEHTFEWEE